MKPIPHIIIGLIFIVGLAPAWMYGYVAGLPLVGYYPGRHADEVSVIALRKNDPTVCGRIIGVPWNIFEYFPVEGHRNSCYTYVAAAKRDVSICAYIQEKHREMCFEAVANAMSDRGAQSN